MDLMIYATLAIGLQYEKICTWVFVVPGLTIKNVDEGFVLQDGDTAFYLRMISSQEFFEAMANGK